MSRWLTSELEGCRVLLRTYDGDREGIVVNVSSETSRITLNKVIDVDTDTSINGLMHFYGQNIKSCVVLDSSARKKSLPEREEEGPRLLRVRPVPAHLERLNASIHSREFICHLFDGDDSEIITKGRVQMMGSPEHLPKLGHPMATEFEVVDQADVALDNALSAINREASIAVCFEGSPVGRNGCLSVLAVVAGTKVFIFDVLTLKDALFDKGLRQVLESKTIEKVIHGCRHLSDCLHHKFRVQLDNVFDTQVADLFIHYNRLGNDRSGCRLPSFVRGVQQCLKHFLHLSHDQLKYTRSRQNQPEGELTVWHQRPLSLRQLDALVKDVAFLPELRRVCQEEFASGFWRGVRYNLCLNRDLDAQELEYAPPEHIVPPGLKDVFNRNANFLNGRSNSRGYREEEGGGEFYGYHDNGRGGSRGSFWQRPKRGFSHYTNGGQHNGYGQETNGHGCDWNSGLFHRVNRRFPLERDNEERAAGTEDSILHLGLRNGLAGLSLKNDQASSKAPLETSGVPEPLKTPEVNSIQRPSSNNSARGGQVTSTTHPRFESAKVSKSAEACWPAKVSGSAGAIVAKTDHVVQNAERAPSANSDWGTREISSTTHLRFRPADLNVAKMAE